MPICRFSLKSWCEMTENRHFCYKKTLSFLSLFFWNSLFFFCCEDFLFFLSVFPFFSRDFRGSVGIKNPCFLVVFLAVFQKKTRKGRTGNAPFNCGNANLPNRLHQGNWRAELKVTEPNLRFPAVFCENLRVSAVSCALQVLGFPGERANLREIF